MSCSDTLQTYQGGCQPNPENHQTLELRSRGRLIKSCRHYKTFSAFLSGGYSDQMTGIFLSLIDKAMLLYLRFFFTLWRFDVFSGSDFDASKLLGKEGMCAPS